MIDQKNLFEQLLRTTTDTGGNPTGTWRFFRPVLVDRQPPCAAVCPAGNNIREFVRLASEKDFRAALAAVKKENPLPSVCGRVCHHPCTANCSRNNVDAPLAVNLIERRLGDMVQDDYPCIPEPRKATGRTIAVVGGGPAGLSCAYHAALLGHKVTIIESGPAPGGMLRWGIPAYRLPREALDRDLSFIRILNIELKLNTTIDSMDDLSSYDAVCLCMGAHAGRTLDIPGADADGVIPGLEFLKRINTGAAPGIGERAIIIGGGNTAMDCARVALRLGAQAHVCYRRSREDMPALPDEIAECEDEGVAFTFHAMPSQIITKNDRVAGVEFIRTEPGEPGPDGRRRPTPVAGGEFTVDADMVITALGENPGTNWLPQAVRLSDDSLKIMPGANLLHAEDLRPGVFAAGDAVGGATRTVSHAVGAGKRAAIAADIFLNGNIETAGKIIQSITIGGGDVISSRKYRASDFQTPLRAVDAKDINPAHVALTAAAPRRMREPARRTSDFDEVNMGLDETDTALEAGRCMSCGSCTSCGTCLLFCPDMSVLHGADNRPAFDYEYCKGCGICLRECPRAAIELIEEEK